eukprot:TRINITY_DN11211_c0_g1_i6.p1 TRINITY_DN11211_c0_g1~~TRINITY_DN11211_c0_g1_i6.p1  ORF type:complete len:721 (+),score=166.73 TRINITY_DN11211_c0_g1_i6:90-2252(+)
MASAAVFALDVIVLLALCAFAFRHYADFRTNYVVTFVVVYTWFLAFAIVLVLPIDVSAAFYMNCLRDWYCDQAPDGVFYDGCGPDEALTNSTVPELCDAAESCTCEPPWTYVSPRLLPVFWRFVYWSSQALAWLVLPILQSYLLAGDFTPWQKFKTSVRSNAVAYISLGIITAVLLVYIAIKKHLTASGLEQIVIAAANTWGLLLVVLMLGYGVVDIPRTLWRRASVERTLRLYYYRLAKLNGELLDAEHDLQDAKRTTQDLLGKCAQTSPMRAYLNLIMAKFPDEEWSDGFAYEDANFKATARGDVTLEQSSLAKLHARVIALSGLVKRCHSQRTYLFAKALLFEDIKKQKDKKERVFTPTYGSGYKGFLKEHRPKIAWYWYMRLRPVAYYIAAACTTALSAVVVWSEVLFFFTTPTLSIYALALNATGDSGYYFNIEVMVFFTLLYLSVCTYRVIFKLRIFNFYQLVPRHTDSASIIFSAILLSRMTAPLGLNFLSMSHLDTHVTEDAALAQPTAFTQVMGHMDVVAFIKDFSTYYPIAMLVVSLATLFHCGPRLMSLCGFQSFISEDDDTSDMVTEGRSLVRAEKRGRQRANPRAAALAERYLSRSRVDDGEDTPSGSAATASSGSNRGQKHDRKSWFGSKKPGRKSRGGFSMSLRQLLGQDGEEDDDEEELLPTTSTAAKEASARLVVAQLWFSHVVRLWWSYFVNRSSCRLEWLE